jgi:hypothetical protein
MAEFEGRLAIQPQINVLINPQWIELRAMISVRAVVIPEG